MRAPAPTGEGRRKQTMRGVSMQGGEQREAGRARAQGKRRRALRRGRHVQAQGTPMSGICQGPAPHPPCRHPGVEKRPPGDRQLAKASLLQDTGTQHWQDAEEQQALPGSRPPAGGSRPSGALPEAGPMRTLGWHCANSLPTGGLSPAVWPKTE